MRIRLGRHTRRRLLISACVVLAAATGGCSDAGWPADLEIIAFESADGSTQRSLYWSPASERPVALLVALHTWSGDFRQPDRRAQLEFCRRRGWAFLHPDFRGPNTNPAAMGSDLAIHDVLTAIATARERRAIDPDRIYLVGHSGGGHMGLLLAARHPELWAGVSVWSPIVDLDAWANEVADTPWRHYGEQIASVCGNGTTDPAVRREACARRSPIHYLRPGLGVPLAIHAGFDDGRRGSVPITHAIRAYNALVPEAARVSREQTASLASGAPVHLQNGRSTGEPSIGDRRALFAREHGNVSLTLFDGHHELLPTAVAEWLVDLDGLVEPDRAQVN